MKRHARLIAILLAAAMPMALAYGQNATNPSDREQLRRGPEAPPPRPPAPGQAIAPPERALTEQERLARLFERLKAVADADAAKPIQAQIERAFERSGSDTADILLKRVKEAIDSKSFETALDLLDYLVILKPDWAEPYHRRAIVHFLQKDHESAMRDIRATLAREPRHFHAMAGFGTLLRAMGNQKAAYRIYKQVLEIHPYFGDLKEQIDKMKTEVEGLPI